MSYTFYKWKVKITSEITYITTDDLVQVGVDVDGSGTGAATYFYVNPIEISYSGSNTFFYFKDSSKWDGMSSVTTAATASAYVSLNFYKRSEFYKSNLNSAFTSYSSSVSVKAPEKSSIATSNVSFTILIYTGYSTSYNTYRLPYGIQSSTYTHFDINFLDSYGVHSNTGSYTPYETLSFHYIGNYLSSGDSYTMRKVYVDMSESTFAGYGGSYASIRMNQSKAIKVDDGHEVVIFNHKYDTNTHKFLITNKNEFNEEQYCGDSLLVFNDLKSWFDIEMFGNKLLLNIGNKIYLNKIENLLPSQHVFQQQEDLGGSQFQLFEKTNAQSQSDETTFNKIFAFKNNLYVYFYNKTKQTHYINKLLQNEEYIQYPIISEVAWVLPFSYRGTLYCLYKNNLESSSLNIGHLVFSNSEFRIVNQTTFTYPLSVFPLNEYESSHHYQVKILNDVVYFFHWGYKESDKFERNIYTSKLIVHDEQATKFQIG